jgi:hypothetical protein
LRGTGKRDATLAAFSNNGTNYETAEGGRGGNAARVTNCHPTESESAKRVLTGIEGGSQWGMTISASKATGDRATLNVPCSSSYAFVRAAELSTQLVPPSSGDGACPPDSLGQQTSCFSNEAQSRTHAAEADNQIASIAKAMMRVKADTRGAYGFQSAPATSDVGTSESKLHSRHFDILCDLISEVID